MAATRNRPSPDPLNVLLHALLGQLQEVAGRLADPARAAQFPAQTSPAGSLEGLRCVVGLSGGRDSIVLLHALAGLRRQHGLQVSALHVNHGLSPHADAWAAFCRDTCKSLDVPLAIERVVVDRCSGLGLEGAAREARYAAFRRVDADVLLLAHHAGDQAETLLFNLLRGAGLRGAAGMPPVRALEPAADRRQVLLLRPWLEIGVARIEAYRQHFGLQHIEDESNADTHFSRNFLRQQIMPRLEGRFPGAAERLAGAARRLAEARGLNDELADLDLLTVAPASRVELAALHDLSAARQRNLLRRWLERQGTRARLGEDALDELRRQLRDAATDAQVMMPAGPLVLRVWRGGLYALPTLPADAAAPAAVAGPVETSVAGALPPARVWRGEPAVDWAGGRLHFSSTIGAGIARSALSSGPLEIRPRQGGERIRLAPGRASHSVKTLLQAAGLPPWERRRLPFLWFNDVLVAIPGIGVADGFAAGADEAGVLLRWESVPSAALAGRAREGSV